MARRTEQYLISLIHELIKFDTETEWVEFKTNNCEPQLIGEYISALSNSAKLWERPYAYLIWGIDDVTHEIVGSDFNYRKERRGNEELEAWLTRLLNPKINFKFFEQTIDGKSVTILEIPNADGKPTAFSGVEYIRVGTTKKSLKDYPDKERELWQSFASTVYELRTYESNYTVSQVLKQLNYKQYYHSLELPVPDNSDKIVEDLIKDKMIKRNDAGFYNLTNMGIILLANDMNLYDGYSIHSVRVIWYQGNNRLETRSERVYSGGYLNSFEQIIDYLRTILAQEIIEADMLRKQGTVYPLIALRELLANTLIHQSFERRGTHPTIEIFSNRIEFVNPGAPLIAIERIIDTVPVSRNENIAGFMHRCGICEERGSGYDKIVRATSQNKMLAPRIEVQDNQFTKVILLAKVPFAMTSRRERISTCYMQACLLYVNFESLSNANLREVFGLTEKESYKTSRIIKDALDEGLIKPVDPDTAPRYMRYIPFWA